MEDNSMEDDDLYLQRASIGAIEEVKSGIRQLGSCFDLEYNHADLQYAIRRQKLVDTISSMLNVFQEDPQLLDAHIKIFMPPLTSRFVSNLSSLAIKQDLLAFEHLKSLANIIYTICKVRGEKVVLRFLDNEPKHLTPLLQALRSVKPSRLSNNLLQDSSKNDHIDSLTHSSEDQEIWKLRYVLLIWTGCLILTPFDLQTLSTHGDQEIPQIHGLDLQDVPNIGQSLVAIALDYVQSPTKERTSAASMLAKLTLRPDMVKSGLLGSLIDWAVVTFSNDTTFQVEQVRTFVLEFIYGLVRTANVHDISSYLPKLYLEVYKAFEDESLAKSDGQHSAVATKLAIKVLRSIIVQILQISGSSKPDSQFVYDKMMNQMGILEEVIDFLLRSLAHRDTQVRNAASKALSMITLKLEYDMGQEVVEAVIDSLNEDVLAGQRLDDLQDLSAVNPLRWHGLTLSLSFLLFRRSPSPNQLESILNALYRTLAFEQRSATGNSLGTNVRDAANFGLWSLARRYTTLELLDVPFTQIPQHIESSGTISKIQETANKLLCSACFDPSGNVRRGSSAALQELVGRHPDEIKLGIALVQIVDFQAVGLRRRAMVEVSYRAACLKIMYLLELLEESFGWRGLLAPDTMSRNFAAKAVGQLVTILPPEQRDFFIGRLIKALRALPRAETEARHGFSKALAEVISQSVLWVNNSENLQKTLGLNPVYIAQIWSLFDETLRRSEKELYAPSARPDLMTEAIVSLILSLSSLKTYQVKSVTQSRGNTKESQLEAPQIAMEMLSLSLQSMDATTITIIPDACSTLFMNLRLAQRVELVETWLKDLQVKLHSRRRTGIMLALASVWSMMIQSTQDQNELQSGVFAQQQILEAILAVYELDNVDARAACIKSLRIIVDGLQCRDERIFEIFLRGLNDYTTNERGDVGSLVRLEAIQALTSIAPAFLDIHSKSAKLCCLSIQRLALERLDKVRLQAAQCLQKLWPNFSLSLQSLRDVSTFEYFSALSISILFPPARFSDDDSTIPKKQDTIDVLLEGVASSASGGSDSLAGVVRSSVCTVLSGIPLSQNNAEIGGPTSPHLAQETISTLLDLSNGLARLLKVNLGHDRVLSPLLDLTLLLFDSGLVQQLYHFIAPAQKPNPSSSGGKVTDADIPTFKPLVFLSLVQKSHFKSLNLQKLLTCVQIYRHLAQMPDENTRKETLKKLGSMLGHPFPKVRVQVAEVLWVVTGEKALRNVDWSSARAPSEAKSIARLLV